MEEEEHEVYGQEIPDEGEMDGEMETHGADVDMAAAEEDAVKMQELDEMKKRLKDMEEEAAALREMQAKVEKEMGAVQDPASAAANQASKEEVDSRSVFVGNERHTSKDGSTCAFRLSSEGLPLLLPYISKQVLFASLADFQHLLQYRTIKFPDFVDSKFGEEASNLVPGCCVVVLGEGNRNTDSTAVDASTVAIVCWKGKTNISIMVSPLDGKELLERLVFRFATKSTSLEEGEKSNMEIEEGVHNLEDVEAIAAIETDNQEIEC